MLTDDNALMDVYGIGCMALSVSDSCRLHSLACLTNATDCTLAPAPTDGATAWRFALPSHARSSCWVPGSDYFVSAVGVRLLLFQYPTVCIVSDLSGRTQYYIHYALLQTGGIRNSCSLWRCEDNLHQGPIRDMDITRDALMVEGGCDGRLNIIDLKGICTVHMPAPAWPWPDSYSKCELYSQRCI